MTSSASIARSKSWCKSRLADDRIDQFERIVCFGELRLLKRADSYADGCSAPSCSAMYLPRGFAEAFANAVEVAGIDRLGDFDLATSAGYPLTA